MNRQVLHLSRLIDDLFDVSRISRGKVELRRERIALSTVLERAVELVRPHLESGQHELVVELGTGTTYLDADPIRLAQVFSNLLHNACRYSENGGEIRLHAEQQAGHAVVRVVDNGIGISPQHLPHVFEMFSQADALAERAKAGLGIGLSLARGIVELHGGTITARSAGLGYGSEFEVRLPAAARQA
jgi:signal transduction histidine kinase